MDFAIAPVSRAVPPPGAGPADRWESDAGSEWAVLWLQERCGIEVARHLARFGHRSHAEAFLADLLASAATGRDTAVGPRDSFE